MFRLLLIKSTKRRRTSYAMGQEGEGSNVQLLLPVTEIYVAQRHELIWFLGQMRL